MKLTFFSPFHLGHSLFSLGLILLFSTGVLAQGNSVVLVHADKNSGYGVAWGGPQNSPDMIVTALHLVAGKKAIQVVWQGKTSTATVEKIYKPSDLALLKLKTPLGVPSLSLYSGEPPWDTNINFWEIPTATTTPTKKTTVLEGKTSLANISPQIADEPTGLTRALCFDGSESYPGMKTSVINFKEVNIRKAHSGSPLTYGDKILGMVDGGAKLVDGKPCIWAIPASDFNKLYTLGTPPAIDMVSCSQGSESKYLYSGIRPDNPFLTEEEIDQAVLLNIPLNIISSIGTQLELHHNYSMTFEEVYATLFEEEQQYLTTLFKPSETITLNDLLNKTVHFYSEDNTGVSIMIPDQCTLSSSVDAFGTLNTTSSPGGLITMSIYISDGKTMEDGVNAMNAFQKFLKPNDPDYKPIDQKLLNANNQYYNDYFEKKTKDSRGSIKSIYYANMTINQGNFLAVTINVPDWSAVANNSNEKLYFYLMEVCTVLSDFPLY